MKLESVNEVQGESNLSRMKRSFEKLSLLLEYAFELPKANRT